MHVSTLYIRVIPFLASTTYICINGHYHETCSQAVMDKESINPLALTIVSEATFVMLSEIHAQAHVRWMVLILHMYLPWLGIFQDSSAQNSRTPPASR